MQLLSDSANFLWRLSATNSQRTFSNILKLPTENAGIYKKKKKKKTTVEASLTFI
jgi:hypothetical protein